jgi:ribosomal protein L7/L12
MEDSRIPAHERKQEFLDALSQGQKIQAIKIYREMTGLGLKESKDAVEQLMAEMAGKGIPDHERTQEFYDALLAGRKIEAIKICREMTNCSLKEARDMVEQIMAELAEKHPGQVPKPSQSGCGTAALMLVLVLAAMALAAVFAF